MCRPNDYRRAVRLHHLAFRTGDLPRLVAFYAGVLGLPTRRGSPHERSVWLLAGETVLMLERADPGELSELSELSERTPSQELVAFAVDEAERESWLARLAEHGVPVEARTEHTLYFRDPDGRRVAVSSYPFAL